MECLSLIVTIGTCRNTRNVTGAQRELLKYYASITSNRWLMLKIFGVLIIFVSIRSSIFKAPTKSYLFGLVTSRFSVLGLHPCILMNRDMASHEVRRPNHIIRNIITA